MTSFLQGRSDYGKGEQVLTHQDHTHAEGLQDHVCRRYGSVAGGNDRCLRG